MCAHNIWLEINMIGLQQNKRHKNSENHNNLFHQSLDEAFKCLSCPPLNDIEFSVIEDERNQKKMYI